MTRSGLLQQAPQGKVYVDLDDNWILAVRELLNEYGYESALSSSPPSVEIMLGPTLSFCLLKKLSNMACLVGMLKLTKRLTSLSGGVG